MIETNLTWNTSNCASIFVNYFPPDFVIELIDCMVFVMQTSCMIDNIVYCLSLFSCLGVDFSSDNMLSLILAVRPGHKQVTTPSLMDEI